MFSYRRGCSRVFTVSFKIPTPLGTSDFSIDKIADATKIFQNNIARNLHGSFFFNTFASA